MFGKGIPLVPSLKEKSTMERKSGLVPLHFKGRSHKAVRGWTSEYLSVK